MKSFNIIILFLFGFLWLQGQKHIPIYDDNPPELNTLFTIDHSNQPLKVSLLDINQFDAMLNLPNQSDPKTYWNHIQNNWNQKIGVAIFGFGDGMADTLKDKYDNTWLTRFGPDFQQWADPRISWRNKYKNGRPGEGPKFPLSNGALVFLTDAWHLSKTIRNTGFRMGMYTYNRPPKNKWQYYIYDFLLDLTILGVSWQLSSHLMQIR